MEVNLTNPTSLGKEELLHLYCKHSREVQKGIQNNDKRGFYNTLLFHILTLNVSKRWNPDERCHPP